MDTVQVLNFVFLCFIHSFSCVLCSKDEFRSQEHCSGQPGLLLSLRSDGAVRTLTMHGNRRWYGNHT